MSVQLDHACRNLGDVNTNHHAVTLRVKSLLDSCNEGLDEHCNSGQCSTYVDDLGENEVDSAMQVHCLHMCLLTSNHLFPCLGCMQDSSELASSYLQTVSAG